MMMTGQKWAPTPGRHFQFSFWPQPFGSFFFLASSFDVQWTCLNYGLINCSEINWTILELGFEYFFDEYNLTLHPSSYLIIDYKFSKTFNLKIHYHHRFFNWNFFLNIKILFQFICQTKNNPKCHKATYKNLSKCSFK